MWTSLLIWSALLCSLESLLSTAKYTNHQDMAAHYLYSIIYPLHNLVLRKNSCAHNATNVISSFEDCSLILHRKTEHEEWLLGLQYFLEQTFFTLRAGYCFACIHLQITTNIHYFMLGSHGCLFLITCE